MQCKDKATRAWGYPITWQILQWVMTAIVLLWLTLLLWVLFFFPVYPMSGYGGTMLVMLVIVLLLMIIAGLELLHATHSQRDGQIQSTVNFAIVSAGLLVISVMGLWTPLTLYTTDVLLFIACLVLLALALVAIAISVTLIQYVDVDLSPALHTAENTTPAGAYWSRPPPMYPFMFDSK